MSDCVTMSGPRSVPRAKRAQVAMFVIVGLVLLLVVGLLFLVPRNAQDPKTQEDRLLVEVAVQSCLTRVGEEAVLAVGQRGGYATMAELRDTRQGYTRDTQVVTNVIEDLPLWHEVQTPNDAPMQQHNHRPPLCAQNSDCPVPDARGPKSIQENIELLVVERIDACLGNFTGVPTVIVQRQGQPKARAQIREADVQMTLTYPLLVTTRTDDSFEITEFHAGLDVRLPDTYRLARTIQRGEQQTQFLEEIFLHFIASYAGATTPLPPFREVTTERSARDSWSLQDVKRDIELDVLPYLNFIQVVNAGESYAPITSGRNDSYEPYATGVYQLLTQRFGNDTYPLAVRFEYPDTPMYLDINGKEDLKPRGVPGGWLLKIIGMQIQDYRFRYSASFPVIVRVSDPAAFTGRGFELSYAMEANVRNNVPLNVTEELLFVDFATTGLNLGVDEQRTNHTYEIVVIDNTTGLPVGDARVLYACGPEYYIGDVVSGSWTGALPYCLTGGTIIADAEGYLRTTKDQDNTFEDGGSSRIQLYVWPTAEKPVRVVKLSMTGSRINGNVPALVNRSLTANDSVIIEISRLKSTAHDTDFPLEAVLSFGGVAPQSAVRGQIEEAIEDIELRHKEGTVSDADYESVITSLRELNLTLTTTEWRTVVYERNVTIAPGRYAINGLLTHVAPAVLPAVNQAACCARYGCCGPGAAACAQAVQPVEPACALWIRGANEAIPYPEHNMSSLQTGGILFQDTTAVELSSEFVYSPRPLIVYVIEQQMPKNWDEFNAMQEVEELQRYVAYEGPDFLLPVR